MLHSLQRMSFVALVATWSLVLSALVVSVQPAAAMEKKQVEASAAQAAVPTQALATDEGPGLLRIGNTQILYGTAPVSCDSPTEVCQFEVKFQTPFVEQPVVSLTTLASTQTQKVGVSCLLNEKLTQNGFSARLLLQSNVKELKKVPWMAIGRWR